MQDRAKGNNQVKLTEKNQDLIFMICAQTAVSIRIWEIGRRLCNQIMGEDFHIRNSSPHKYRHNTKFKQKIHT